MTDAFKNGSRRRLFASKLAIGALLSPLLMAAAPAQTTPLPTGTFALATVARIVPQSVIGPGLTEAPTPNATVAAPVALDGNSKSPELAPGLWRRKKTYGGEGFIDGSTVQDQAARKVSPAAGIALKVPLD